ncbi:MAG: DUF2207 domain-containing protein [Ancrocorticia sp.]
MSQIIAYFQLTNAEFWSGILLIGVAALILLIAIRPEREYALLPRGVFPEGDEPQPTRHVTGGEPPMRIEQPQMSPAEAALIYRDAGHRDIALCMILDLAVRGFVELVEYRYLSKGRPLVVVAYLNPADDTCTPEERLFLDQLAVPGAVENQPYARSHPFDSRRFRSILEDLGIPPVGVPSGRLSGLRRSITDRMSGAVVHRIHDEYGWLRPARGPLSSAGGLEFVGGLVGAVVAFILMQMDSLSPFWLIVCLMVALLGILTMFGGAVRTTDGTVARDQCRGFRRFLVAPPPGTDMTYMATLAPWAFALGCLNEWGRTLDRMAVMDDRPIADVAHGFIRTSSPLVRGHDLVDMIALMKARFQDAPESNDTKPENHTDVLGWQDMNRA